MRKTNFPKIIVIDSGLDSHERFLWHRVIDCYNASEIHNKKKTNMDDYLGHGTACVKAILNEEQNVELFIAKVFDKELGTFAKQIYRALKWAILKDVDIINLSLGANYTSNQEKIKMLIKRAVARNITIVAADSPNHQRTLPASLPMVIGVGVDPRNKSSNIWYTPNSEIQFLGSAGAKKVAWSGGRSVFIGGASFLVPVLTGKIAKFIKRNGRQPFSKVLNYLKNEVAVPMPKMYQNTTLEKFTKRPQQNLPNIKKAVLYPLNKEIVSLLEFDDLLKFKINAVVDVPGRGTIGKLYNRKIAGGKNEYLIKKDLSQALVGADTLVLGHLGLLSQIKRRDLTEEALHIALKFKKNVYTFDPLNHYARCKRLIKKIQRLGRFVRTPNELHVDRKAMYASPEYISKVPVVGVFGTNTQQGKFSVQMVIRRNLLQKGYRVGQVITEPQGELVGADVTFPIGYNGAIPISIEEYIPFMRYEMKKIEAAEKEIILFGGQSGFIPFSLEENSNLYSLPNIAMLWGCKPDAVVLVINSYDSVEYISDTIKAIEICGKTKVIALVLSSVDKEGRKFQTRELVIEKRIAGEKLQARVKFFKNRLGIFTTEIITVRGQNRLINRILQYLS